MSIKKIYATQDSTITDSYKPGTLTRATSSNMGASDILELYSVYGQVTDESLERSRALIQFDISALSASRVSGEIPASGSVKFYLNIYNAKHSETYPKDYTIGVYPITLSWDEGYGMDMENFSDEGGLSVYGCTWRDRGSNYTWTTEGGDFTTTDEVKVNLTTGLEDMSADVTTIVEKWLNGTRSNNGLMLKLSGSFESGSLTSLYTKKYFARTTQYFFKKPHIAAVWDASVQDSYNGFYLSASYLSSDNIQSIYYHNIIDGEYRDLPSTPTIQIRETESTGSTQYATGSGTVSKVSTGLYKASFALNLSSSIEEVYSHWFYSSDLLDSKKIVIKNRRNDNYNVNYVLKIPNLKQSYLSTEKINLNVYARNKDWSPTIYTIAFQEPEITSIKNLFYKVVRSNDNLTVLDYQTGSVQYTKTSTDENGNSFDFDFSLLEPDFSYYFQFAIYQNSKLKEIPQTFKFRVA